MQQSCGRVQEERKVAVTLGGLVADRFWRNLRHGTFPGLVRVCGALTRV